MDSSSLFSRAEALGGLPARRAHTILYLIESRSARLTARARQAMTPFRSEQAAADGELSFITAFAEGRDPPLKPSIQDLESFSAEWAPLVPREPRLRAAIGHALAAKYTFTRQAVPGIRSVLGLEEKAVQDAFLNQYGTSLASIYQATPSSLERLRWAWSSFTRRLESLPPFWTSFALTLTETVGAGTLALPIALAGVGPLPGIGIMVVLGLVNVVTIICAAEAAARSATVRYGSGFMGRMVHAYLGRWGGIVLTIAVAILCFLTLPVLYIGFGSAMAGFTGLPQTLWVAGLFLAGLAMLRRESLDATVGSALVIGAVNIGIILLLSLLAFARLDPANLRQVDIPFVGGKPFDPSLLELIFGVILMAFFGHVSVNNCAQVVLRRDASARSLIGGAAAAQVVTIVMYSIWCLAVAGAVPAEVLRAETGTALAPLANRIGPIAIVLSSIYVVLALAIGSLYSSLGLYNLVRERLPGITSLSVRLPRAAGQLILTPRRTFGDLFRPVRQVSRLAITYTGLDDSHSHTPPRPRLRIDLTLGDLVHVVDTTLDRPSWDESALAGLLGELAQQGIRLNLEVVGATDASIHLRIATPMAMRYEGRRESAGLDLAALLDMEDADRHVWTWLARQPHPVSLAEIAAAAGVDERSAQALVKALIQQRLVSADLTGGQVRYRGHFAARRGRSLPGNLLHETASPGSQETNRPEIRPRLLAGWTDPGTRGRYWLCALPTIVAFLLTEYLVSGGGASFSGAFSLIGVLVASLLAGFFPVLLLVASRRKGDIVPGVAPRLVGHPLVLGLVYLLNLASLLLHGLVIWQEPVQRIAAIGLAALAIGMPIAMVRGGAFRRRAVIEVHAHLDVKQPATFAVSASGRPHPTDVELHYDRADHSRRAAEGEIPDFAGLRTATFRWAPATEVGGADQPPPVAEVKVWTHALGGEGDDQELPATVEMRSGDEVTACSPVAPGGQVVLPLATPPGWGALAVQVTFQGPPLGEEGQRSSQARSLQ